MRGDAIRKLEREVKVYRSRLRDHNIRVEFNQAEDSDGWGSGDEDEFTSGFQHLVVSTYSEHRSLT